jgi:hypothetical protein
MEAERDVSSRPESSFMGNTTSFTRTESVFFNYSKSSKAIKACLEEGKEISIHYSVMVGFVYFVTLALVCASSVTAFPAYQSLAGLSRDEVDAAMANLKPARPSPPPGPLAFSGTKLVNDAQHPYRAPGRNDIRGPCPALNALASHGVRRIF